MVMDKDTNQTEQLKREAAVALAPCSDLCVRHLPETVGATTQSYPGPAFPVGDAGELAGSAGGGSGLIDEAGSRFGMPGDLRSLRRLRVRILALGDVGTNLLIGLRLLGGDCIQEIGICDLNKNQLARLEREINQIRYPFAFDSGEPSAGLPLWHSPSLPNVRCVEEDELFNGDVFIFCASRSVPDLSHKGDVRMAQLEANRGLVRHFAGLAKAASYSGLVCIVSDPVDPLCAAFLDASGLSPGQIQGYGLGVMSARAMYYAERNPRWEKYLREGRAYGPHGNDLVIADSLTDYNDEVSRELTAKTVSANTEVRELGYKPFLAPAFSSAAISILLTLSGRWHYGSVYLGDNQKGAYFGVKNRLKADGSWQLDDPSVPDALFQRLRVAYRNLVELREEYESC